MDLWKAILEVVRREEVEPVGVGSLVRVRTLNSAAAALATLWAGASPCPAMQAAVEYATQAGASTARSSPAQGAHVGVCRLNPQVISCVSHNYPAVLVAVIATVALLLLISTLRSFRRVRF